MILIDPNKKIGKAVGLTNKMVDKYGPLVLLPDGEGWTIKFKNEDFFLALTSGTVKGLTTGDGNAVSLISGVLNHLLDAANSGASIPEAQAETKKIDDLIAFDHAAAEMVSASTAAGDALKKFVSTLGITAGKTIEIFNSGEVGETANNAPQLKDATELGQEVRSSDPTSRYHVIALSEGLNMAYRCKEGGGAYAISIRLEGPKTKHLVAMANDNLAAVGLNDKVGYISGHFAVPDTLTAKRAVGAIIYGLGHTFDKVLVDVDSLVGKGK